MKILIRFVLLLFASQLLAKAQSGITPFQPVRVIDSNQLRITLIKYISETPVLRDLLKGHKDLHSLPFHMQEWHPEQWPNEVISSQPYNTFATLGPWKIFFGRRPSESVIPAVPYNTLQCAVYDVVIYAADRALQYQRLVLDLRPDSNKPTANLNVRGWYIQEFEARDEATKIVANSVIYTAGGGEWKTLKWLGAGEISTAIVEPAFRGYVTLVVPAQNN